MNQELIPAVTGKVAVLARDSNGAPDLLFYDVSCSKADRSEGKHYDEAERLAVSDGYEPVISFDDFDPAWSRIQLLAQNRELALNMLLHGLSEIGFGGDGEINGADCVDSINVLYYEVVDETLQGKKGLPLAMILSDESATAMAVAEVAGVELLHGDQPGGSSWSWRARGKESSQVFDSKEDAAVHAMNTLFQERDWREEVVQGNTRRGYLEWAHAQAEQYRDENVMEEEGV